jgi:hypothetical protein
VTRLHVPEPDPEFALYAQAGFEAALGGAADDPVGEDLCGGPAHGPAHGPEAERLARLLADCREVMCLPSGAGLRLLWHWREQALAFGQVFVPGAAVYANAALMDYAREREAEMAMAHPRKYLELMTLAARAHAREAAAATARRR